MQNKEIEKIIDDFEFKIKKSLRHTSHQEREDLEQEIKLKIVEKVQTVNFKEPPSFWWLLNEEELKKKLSD
jgi:predicted component of type VI protein secretion system